MEIEEEHEVGPGSRPQLFFRMVVPKRQFWSIASPLGCEVMRNCQENRIKALQLDQWYGGRISLSAGVFHKSKDCPNQAILASGPS